MSKKGNEFDALGPLLRGFRLTTMLASLEELTASPSFLLPAWHPYKTRACVAKALQSRRSFQFRLHRWAGPFPIDPEYLVDPALLRVWQARLAHRHDPSVLQRQPGAH